MNIDELNHAWQLAEAAHRGQYYGYDADQIPYVYHLGNVLLEARNAVEHTPGCPARIVLLAAILHDALEDTDLTADAVKTAFGPAVLTAVQALTKNEALPKAEQMPDSLARIRAAGPAAAMVKLCDRIANLSRRPPQPLGRRMESSLPGRSAVDPRGTGGKQRVPRGAACRED